MVKRLRPVMIVINIVTEILIGHGKGVTAFSFDIFFVAANYRIVKKVCLSVRLYLFVADVLFISDELSLVLFVLLEVFGVKRLDNSDLFDGVYLAQLVNVLKPGLVTHY